MVIRTSRAVIAVCAIAAAAALAFFLRNSEEDKILKVFGTVEHELNNYAGEQNMIAVGLCAKRLADTVEDGAEIRIPEAGVDYMIGRRELTQNIAAMLAKSGRMSMSFDALRVTMLGPAKARVNGDVSVKGGSSGFGFSGIDAREVDATMAKSPEDGKWRFSVISVNPIVTK